MARYEVNTDRATAVGSGICGMNGIDFVPPNCAFLHKQKRVTFCSLKYEPPVREFEALKLFVQPVESLVITIRQDISNDLYLRVGRAMEHLVGLIKEAYARPSGNSPDGVPTGFRASHGESGAISAINYDVQRAQTFIEATIGLADSARYLRNLEFGERGTQGGPSTGALFSRSKAPPVRNVFEWLRLANIETPQYFKDRAARFAKEAASTHPHPSFDKNKDKPWYSTDANMQFAFAIAMKRKRLGRPAMRVIERTIQQHSDAITSYLNGQAA